MKKKIVATLMAAVLALGLAGCGSEKQSDKTDAKGTNVQSEQSESSTDEETAEAGKNNSEALKTLRLGCGGQDDTMLMEIGSVAYSKGYLEEELNAVGYTAEIHTFVQTGPEVNEAIASGALDGAIYGDMPAFVSNSNGVGTTIIATANSKLQYGILSVDPNIKEPKDLEGRKVIVSQGTVLQHFWEEYAAEKGVDTSKVEIINTADPTSLLQTGEADAYVSLLHSVNYMADLGLGQLFDDGTDMENGTSTSVVILENDFLKEHPDVAVAINKALIRAYEDAQADVEDFYEAVATPTESAEIMKIAYEFDTSLYYMSPEITDETMAYFERFNHWLVDNQLIAEPVDLDTLIDTSYYEKAVSELGK